MLPASKSFVSFQNGWCSLVVKTMPAAISMGVPTVLCSLSCSVGERPPAHYCQASVSASISNSSSADACACIHSVSESISHSPSAHACACRAGYTEQVADLCAQLLYERVQPNEGAFCSNESGHQLPVLLLSRQTSCRPKQIATCGEHLVDVAGGIKVILIENIHRVACRFLSRSRAGFC